MSHPNILTGVILVALMALGGGWCSAKMQERTTRMNLEWLESRSYLKEADRNELDHLRTFSFWVQFMESTLVLTIVLTIVGGIFMLLGYILD